jgi:hypothetical protein
MPRIVPRRVIHAEARLEYRIQSEAQSQHAEQQRRQLLRDLQDGGGAEHHPRQSGTEDDQREAALEMAFPEMSERGAEAERDAGDLVGGERHAERQTEKNQHGKLDQACAAAGQGRKEVGRQRGDEEDDLVEHNGAQVTPVCAGRRA